MEAKGEIKVNPMKAITSLFAFACALAISAAHAQAQTTAPVKVTPETYIRAETDRQFAEIAKMAGGIKPEPIGLVFVPGK